jgi:putative endonuclease
MTGTRSSPRKSKPVKSKKTPWFVYILECADGTYYTGIAKDPQARFKAHASGRGARYTAAHKPLRIIFLEKQKDVSRAMKREIEVKRLPKKKKSRLALEWLADHPPTGT